MQSPNSDAPVKTPPRSRRTLWILVAVCVAPMIASYAAFHFWRPSAKVNYGELIEPRQLPDLELTTPEGRAFRMTDLKGEWVLVTAGPAACDEACRRELVYIRQVRLAQGKESARIERLWLLSGEGVPDAALIAEHPGLIVARGGEAIIKSLPAPREAADHIFVVDPLGHVMMRYPANPDPQRMLKDLSRLLRHSKWK